MRTRTMWIAALAALVLVTAGLTVFTVGEREKAIKFQLGRIVRADYQPGLHFKIPFVQTVRKFDARIQNIDAEPQLYLTSQKKNVSVDSFVKWRIEEVERYYTATGGNPLEAADRLTAVIQKRLKDEFAKRTIFEVVSGERAQIMNIVTREAQEHASGLGVRLVDVRVKRIDLPEAVRTSVFERMKAERKEVAQAFRARGHEAGAVIRAKAEREREVLLAEADRDAERIRGKGDAEAAAIYARAYGQNDEFYRFYRSLNAYRDVFNQRSDVLLLEPDTEFFRYFGSADGTATGPSARRAEARR